MCGHSVSVVCNRWYRPAGRIDWKRAARWIRTFRSRWRRERVFRQHDDRGGRGKSVGGRPAAPHILRAVSQRPKVVRDQRAHAAAHAGMHIDTSTCKSICTHTHTHLHMYIYTHTYIYIYICMCVNVCRYIHSQCVAHAPCVISCLEGSNDKTLYTNL